MIPGFSSHREQLGEVEIAWSMGGEGPTVLLLHGFPQNRAMWAAIAPLLAGSHRVICPDLRGYGDSGKPQAVSKYSFRHMARDQIALMEHLGISRFSVIGHDRGARVAHRLALDAPKIIQKLCLMDIVPTIDLLDHLKKEVANSYYHWFFLAQPEPFPETLIRADPDFYFHACLTGWGSARLEDFDPQQLSAYRKAWRNPECIRGMCNDYRAALDVDHTDDTHDADRQVSCATLVLYGADGVMAKYFDMPSAWSDKCTALETKAIPGGHFFPDTNPLETLNAINDFL